MTAVAVSDAPFFRSGGWSVVTHPGDVVQILEPQLQVCSWQRPIDDQVEEWLRLRAPAVGRRTLEILDSGANPTLDTLPDDPERSAFAEDLAMLGELFCDLLGCPSYGLRVAHVSDAMCPGWHIDKVTLRIVCTYCGPGTQWLTDQTLSRDLLREPTASLGSCENAAVGDVVFLKGAGWPGNERYGAIHRSPQLPSATGLRTVVTLDPMWGG